MDIFNKKRVKELQDLNKNLKLELAQLNKSLAECTSDKTGLKNDFESFKEKFKSITDIQKEIEIQKSILDSTINKSNSLKEKYKEKKAIYNELSKEVSQFEHKLEMVSYGIYEPIFEYNDSASFKSSIIDNVNKQKSFIKEERAIKCLTNWSVGGSEREGEKMVKRQMKLMLRAFNGECDSLIAKTKWNNVTSLEIRLFKSFNAINKLGNSSHIYIERDYLDLKIKQLKLNYEYHLKIKEEKENEREIKQRIREEEKAQRDFERAKKKAETDEKNYQKFLEKARAELGLVSGEKLEKLNAQIEDLEKSLEEAQERKERALSMAQQTRSGYVYVISNIGSFGKDVYKIGLTRRLEPMDRVRELGDASVPFKFDVHAMIYSEDAPFLEKQLHQIFKDKSLNLVNFRKEFFKVTLQEIKQAVEQYFEGEVEFYEIPEAQEYRETSSILTAKIEAEEKEQALETMINKFPEALD